jgi:hypothetical protein
MQLIRLVTQVLYALSALVKSNSFPIDCMSRIRHGRDAIDPFYALFTLLALERCQSWQLTSRHELEVLLSGTHHLELQYAKHRCKISVATVRGEMDRMCSTEQHNDWQRVNKEK